MSDEERLGPFFISNFFRCCVIPFNVSDFNEAWRLDSTLANEISNLLRLLYSFSSGKLSVIAVNDEMPRK